MQFWRAWSLVRVQHRRVEGIREFQELLQSSPSAWGYYLLACALQQESRHEQAVVAFREAFRLDSRVVGDFHYNHATSLVALRRFEEAADEFKNAAQLNPSDGAAWGNLGMVLAELGRWRDAAPCLERSLRLAPSLAYSLILANTLFELNRLEDAERVTRAALELNPQALDGKETLARILTGQDRHQEALELAREITALNPSAASSRVVLAGVLREAGQLDAALEEAKAAVDLAPSEPGAYGALGATYLKMNDGAAALSAFAQMANCIDPDADRRPSWSSVWCDLGRGIALSLLGRHDEALSAFDQVLRADPEFFERWPEMAADYHRSLGESARTKRAPGTF
jgi:tetratricopeptide (TPR) repeat protein